MNLSGQDIGLLPTNSAIEWPFVIPRYRSFAYFLQSVRIMKILILAFSFHFLEKSKLKVQKFEIPLRSDFKKVKWFYAKSEILKSTKCLHWLGYLFHSKPIWLQLIIVTARPRTHAKCTILHVPKVTIKRPLFTDKEMPNHAAFLCNINWLQRFVCSTSKLAKDHIFTYQNERFSFKLYLPLSNERIE